uniref:Uncharacterized protein n=1 Tax=Romanomermis culicivorax TaxID=13658 RepID=A0A915JCI6_ROMCU
MIFVVDNRRLLTTIDNTRRRSATKAQFKSEKIQGFLSPTIGCNRRTSEKIPARHEENFRNMISLIDSDVHSTTEPPSKVHLNGAPQTIDVFVDNHLPNGDATSRDVHEERLRKQRSKFATTKNSRNNGKGDNSGVISLINSDDSSKISSEPKSKLSQQSITNVLGAVFHAMGMKRKTQMRRFVPIPSYDKHTFDGEKQFCSMEESPLYILRVCAFGRMEIAEKLLKENPKLLKVEDNKGFTCMHHAVAKNQLAIVDLLLNFGTDVNVANSQTGDTPLHWAVEKNCLLSVKHLLTKDGVNASILNQKGLAPLHLAVTLDRREILEELIQSEKVDKEARDLHDKTAVHYAALLNQDKCMELLMKYDCKLCLTCGFGYYPIHIGAKSASCKTLRLMLEHAHKMCFGYTKEFLLNLTDKELATPLHLAVNSGDPETVRICLENGAKVEATQENKATALHYACSQGSLIIVKILYDHFVEQQTFDDDEKYQNILEMKDCLYMTPLHRAAMYDHEPVVSYLIDK